jgi:hypothetical protein
MATPSFASMEDLGKQVKAKYPDGVMGDGRKYKDLSDKELAARVVQKYPVYKTYIKAPAAAVAKTDTTPKSIFRGNDDSWFSRSDREMWSGLERGVKGTVEGIKGLMTPHDTFGAERGQPGPSPFHGATGEYAMGPIGRLLYNAPADTVQGLIEAEASRQRAARQGEGFSGQAIAYGENLPLVGGLIKKAEEAGPGYVKLSPQTLGAMAEGATYAAMPKVAEKVAPVVGHVAGKTAEGAVRAVTPTVEGMERRIATLGTKIAKPTVEAVTEAHERGLPRESIGAALRDRVNAFDRLQTVEKNLESEKARVGKEMEKTAANYTSRGFFVDVDSVVKKVVDGAIDRAEGRRGQGQANAALASQLKKFREEITTMQQGTNRVPRNLRNMTPTDLFQYEQMIGKYGFEESHMAGAKNVAKDLRHALMRELKDKVPGFEEHAADYSRLIDAVEGVNRQLTHTVTGADAAATHAVAKLNASPTDISSKAIAYVPVSLLTKAMRMPSYTTRIALYRAVSDFLQNKSMKTGQMPQVQPGMWPPVGLGPGPNTPPPMSGTLGPLPPGITQHGGTVPPTTMGAPMGTVRTTPTGAGGTVVGEAAAPVVEAVSKPKTPAKTPATAKPTTVGTAAGAANDTALFQQARSELGPNASISDVARRAQELKTQPAAPTEKVPNPKSETGKAVLDKIYADPDEKARFMSADIAGKRAMIKKVRDAMNMEKVRGKARSEKMAEAEQILGGKAGLKVMTEHASKEMSPEAHTEFVEKAEKYVKAGLGDKSEDWKLYEETKKLLDPASQRGWLMTMAEQLLSKEGK